MHVRLVLAAAAVVALSGTPGAFAKDPEAVPTIKLNPKLPEKATYTTGLETGIYGSDIKTTRPGAKPAQTPPAAETAAVASTPAAVAAQPNLPVIPASQPNATPATPATTAPAGVAVQPVTPATSGTAQPATPAEAAGTVAAPTPSPNAGPQPVTAYATLEQAAKDGIDPLAEKKIEPTVVAAAPPPAPAVKAFNWKDPHAYLAWAQANQEEALRYGGMGLLVLALLVLLPRMRKKR